MSHVTKDIDLRSVVAEAQWICAAEYLGPDRENPSVHRFQAIETLVNLTSEKPPPSQFQVVTPWAVANGMAKRAFQASGVRRSPLIHRLAQGAGFPGRKGEQRLLFLKEHDGKVFVLVAENAALATDQRDRVVELVTPRGLQPPMAGEGDLVFRGKVESIEIAPLKHSQNNFIVTTRILKILKGTFDGSHFSFRIHSPSKSRIEVGQELEVHAERIPEGFRVDPIQFLKPR